MNMDEINRMTSLWCSGAESVVFAGNIHLERPQEWLRVVNGLLPFRTEVSPTHVSETDRGCSSWRTGLVTGLDRIFWVPPKAIKSLSCGDVALLPSRSSE
jgi:hypothetical protein